MKPPKLGNVNRGFCIASLDAIFEATPMPAEANRLLHSLVSAFVLYFAYVAVATGIERQVYQSDSKYYLSASQSRPVNSISSFKKRAYAASLRFINI